MLDLTESEEGRSGGGGEEQTRGSVIRILIVEDHRMMAELLEQALGYQEDFEVVGAVATIDEAVTSVRRERPDVVLMDYMLPDGDGVEATRKVKAVHPEAKVVLVTAVSDQSVLVSAIEAGASGFVPKTRAVQEVVSAIRAAHAGEALVSPSMLAGLLHRMRRDYKGVGADLTPREIEVLRLMTMGRSNRAIADEMVISLHTVRNHVQNILAKLGAHSKLEAVAIARREGIIPPS